MVESNVVGIVGRDELADQLTELLRSGAALAVSEGHFQR